MFHEGRQLPAKVTGMLGVQVDLVLPAVYAKLDGFVSWPARNVVLQAYVDSLHFAPPRRR